MRRRYPSPTLLLALCCVLGIVIFLELQVDWTADAGSERVVEPRSPVPLPEIRAAFVMPDRTTFDQIVDRPLFAPSRRPPADEEPIVEFDEAASPPPIDFALTGVVLAPGERLALITTPESAELLRATVQQTVDGWRIVAIHADRVVVRQSGVTREIRLDIDSR